jgi:hypothetical protein
MSNTTSTATTTAAATSGTTTSGTGTKGTGTSEKGEKQIGYFVQLGGAAAVVVGAILSLHHMAIGAAFLGGAAAIYIGHKIAAV